MALRAAVANGNWSNPSTWFLGVKPVVGDIVAANGFTVTIDENINVDSLTNTAANPVSIIPIMTGPTTPSGVVVVSSQEPSNYLGWKAFDGNTAFTAAWNNNRTYTGVETLEYQFPTPKTVVAYTLQTSASNFPTAWEFQAWNGTAWVVLDSVTGATATISRTFTNTTAYTRYRLAISAPTTQFYLGELRMFEVAADAVFASAGGGFVVNGNYTINVTSSIPGGGSVNLITNNSTGTVALNCPMIYAGSNAFVINHNSTGTLNITGNIIGSGGGAIGCLVLSAAGTVNIVGYVTATTYSTPINYNAAATVNITGDVRMDSAGGGAITINVPAAVTSAVLNITGNVYGQTAGGTSISTISIRGTNARVSIVGNIFSITGTSSGNANVIVAANSPVLYLQIIGSITASNINPNATVVNTNGSSVNLFSGPFISSSTGIVPFLVTRMHLIPNPTSYFEFRDETTNGALPPVAPAPAARLVSPGGAVDAPIPANVRSGISYASGTLLGTMAVPSPSNVANNVPVDNTVGTAVLDPNAIWSVPLTSINTLNSIGRRVKNAATVETTGAQIESILNSL